MVLSTVESYPEFLPVDYATRAKFKKLILDLTDGRVNLDEVIYFCNLN